MPYAGEYYDRTNQVLNRHGGKGPVCDFCKKPKTPIDDHGRFGCFNEKCPSNIGKSFGEMLESISDYSDEWD